MLAFLKAEENTATRIKSHISCHAITELVLKIITVEETPEGMGAMLVGFITSPPLILMISGLKNWEL